MAKDLQPGPARRADTPAAWLALLAGCLLAGGCGLRDRPPSVRAAEPVRPGAMAAPTLSGLPARQWLLRAHDRLGGLLPSDAPPALLTDEMSDGRGQPIDVYDHFAIDPTRLQTLLGNWRGLIQTAQCASGPPTARGPETSPPWPGFEQVWIPVGQGPPAPDAAADGPRRISLSGRLGLARKDGRILDADCIVVLPGLFGDSLNFRDREMARALLGRGLHALALEHRGHGLTEHRHPQVPYLFGVVETGDLLAVAEWLQGRPHVRRIGLVGYSWGANHVLLAAWYDAGAADDGGISERLRRRIRPARSGPHFQAGVVACSPVLDFERFLDRLDTPKSVLVEPALAAIQNIVRQRMILKHYARPGSSLRRLFDLEVARWSGAYPGSPADSHEFLRLLGRPGGPGGGARPPEGGASGGGGKLAAARVPALIIQGANDPMGTAQEVADAVAGLDNANVAAVILPGGGHVGFARYARSYYFSLIGGFFDPKTGPVAVAPDAGGAATNTSHRPAVGQR